MAMKLVWKEAMQQANPFAHAGLYLGYGLTYVNSSQTVPRVQFGYDLHKPYPGYSLATIYTGQTITLGNINIGYGLIVIPGTFG